MRFANSLHLGFIFTFVLFHLHTFVTILTEYITVRIRYKTIERIFDNLSPVLVQGTFMN